MKLPLSNAEADLVLVALCLFTEERECLAKRQTDMRVSLLSEAKQAYVIEDRLRKISGLKAKGQ